MIHGVDLFLAEVDVAVDDDVGVLDLGVERVVIFGVLVEHGHGQLCPLGDAGLLDADVSVFGIGHFCQNDFHGMISFFYRMAPLAFMAAISGSVYPRSRKMLSVSAPRRPADV